MMRRERWKPLFLAPTAGLLVYVAAVTGCLLCSGCSTLTVKGNLVMNADGSIDYAASEVEYYRLTHLPRDLLDALIDAWERERADEGEDDGG